MWLIEMFIKDSVITRQFRCLKTELLKKKRRGKEPEEEPKEKFTGTYVKASGSQSKLVPQLSLHGATSISVTMKSKKYLY